MISLAGIMAAATEEERRWMEEMYSRVLDEAIKSTEAFVRELGTVSRQCKGGSQRFVYVKPIDRPTSTQDLKLSCRVRIRPRRRNWSTVRRKGGKR